MEENYNPIQENGSVSQENMGNTTNQGAKKANTPALLSFIFSLVGLLIAGLPCGIVAVVTGIIGIVKFNKETEKFKWMAIVGIIVGVLDVVAVLLNTILTVMEIL